MSANRPDGQAGFTLVELLVAIAVSGLLTGLLVTGFRTSRAAWQHNATRESAESSASAVRSLLGTLLSQCYPSIAKGDDGKPELSFSGQPTEVDFLAPLPQSFGAEDIVQYRLQFTRDGNLVLGWRFDRSHGEDTGRGAWSALTIADGFAHPAFTYFGAPDTETNDQWQSVWPRRDVLPKLIDVHFDGLGRLGTNDDLVVAPAATAIFCDTSERLQCPG